MDKQIKICVITGTRAEYGLLYPVLKELKSDTHFQIQLIATGSHLSPEFGLTYREIESDGFEINSKIECILSSDSPIGIAKAMGLGLISFSEAFQTLKPDLILVLGDRYEILAAVSAALVAQIPVAHISGGEVTEAAFDDCIRHAITKMSHLHFTSTEIYKKRVLQLGENPKTVFNVGDPAIDNIKQTKLLTKAQLEKTLSCKFKDKNLLITFHPVTLQAGESAKHFKALLSSLEKFKDIFLLFTYPNSDNEGRLLIEMLESFVHQHPDRCISIPSLGRLKYLSALQLMDAVIGNSSSGLVEAPAFNIGTINIGDRQKGRIRTESIIDCGSTGKEITAAIKKLYTPKFQNTLKEMQHPYGKGNAAKQITMILKKVNLEALTMKKFNDL